MLALFCGMGVLPALYAVCVCSTPRVQQREADPLGRELEMAGSCRVNFEDWIWIQDLHALDC